MQVGKTLALFTFLVVLHTLLAGAKTLHIPGLSSKALTHKRLDVTPRDVMTRSSAINCEATCRLTSWCFAANLLPDRRTCQLLSEEVSDDDESLLPAEGWKYIREYAGLFRTAKFCREFIHMFFIICLLFSDVDDCSRLEWSCENGGQAVDTGKSCECQCAAGYTGEHCQTGQSHEL